MPMYAYAYSVDSFIHTFALTHSFIHLWPVLSLNEFNECANTEMQVNVSINVCTSSY